MDVFQASVNLMREEAEVSDVLQENQDFLEVSLSTRLPDHIPDPE